MSIMRKLQHLNNVLHWFHTHF